MTPLVSVVTPAWNAEATLAAAVTSVQAQTVADWEMLIVDDGSTDSSRALAERLAARDNRIGVLGWRMNRGTAAARNAGIRAARGRYLAFLDADDLWRPEKLARQLSVMEVEGHALVFSAYRRVDAAGRPLGVVRPPARVDYAGLLKGNVIGCLTAIYDTAHFGKVEMPPLRLRQDYGLWLALLARGGAACGLPEVLADYRVRKGSLSAGKGAALRATWSLYRDVVGLGRAPAAYYLAHNLARALLKRREEGSARVAPSGRAIFSLAPPGCASASAPLGNAAAKQPGELGELHPPKPVENANRGHPLPPGRGGAREAERGAQGRKQRPHEPA
jgi:teichuronic acid biosynthesis glycosyltransferase TuaG